MADWRAKFQQLVTDLERQRDELRVKAHLAKAEGRDELAKLEQKLEDLKFRASAAGAEAGHTADEVGEAARRLAEEIRSGFDRVRKTL